MQNRLSVAVFALFTFVFLSCGQNKEKHNLQATNTTNAPKAIGPYSQAIKVGKDLYCSGQIGIDPATNAFAGEDIKSQTTQALKNLKAVVEASGSDMGHVAKVTVYLKDLSDYATVNDIYKDFFPGTKPARAAVQVAALPKNALIEMDCVAVVE